MRKGKAPEDLDCQRESELQAQFEKDAVEEPPDEQEDEYERWVSKNCLLIDYSYWLLGLYDIDLRYQVYAW